MVLGKLPITNIVPSHFFVNRKKLVFETAVDVAFLEQTQRHVTELACAVMNSVTHLGYKFPGSNGSGMTVVQV